MANGAELLRKIRKTFNRIGMNMKDAIMTYRNVINVTDECECEEVQSLNLACPTSCLTNEEEEIY